MSKNYNSSHTTVLRKEDTGSEQMVSKIRRVKNMKFFIDTAKVEDIKAANDMLWLTPHRGEGYK